WYGQGGDLVPTGRRPGTTGNRLSRDCRAEAYPRERRQRRRAHRKSASDGPFPLVGATGFEPATSTTPRKTGVFPLLSPSSPPSIPTHGKPLYDGFSEHFG